MSETHAVRSAPLRHPKQLDHHEECSIVFGAVDLTAGGPHASTDLSAAMAAAVGTMGRNGTAVEHQPSTSIDVNGWVTGARNGQVMLNVSATGEKVQGPQGQEVYGTLAEAAGVYTVTWAHSDGAGGNTAFSIPAGTYEIITGYNFPLYKKPANANRSLSRFPTSQDAGAAAGTPQTQEVTIPALIAGAAGAMPDLSGDPRTGTRVTVTINGDRYRVGRPGLTIAGRTITFDPALMGFPLETSDEVFYTFNA